MCNPEDGQKIGILTEATYSYTIITKTIWEKIIIFKIKAYFDIISGVKQTFVDSVYVNHYVYFSGDSAIKHYAMVSHLIYFNHILHPM